MAKIQVRYFVEKPGRAGPRFFWQPSRALAAQGWKPQRLSGDRDTAIREAEARNLELDAWRQGTPGATAPKRKGAAAGTVDELIDAYRDSRFYAALRDNTRRMYEQNLVILSQWAGDKPARAITAKMAQDFYGPMFKATPAKANGLMRVARLLWSRGRLLEKVTANPFEKAGLIGIAKSGKIWPREAVAAFVETADRMGWHSIGTAVILDEWIGQREGDVLRLPRTIYRAGRLVLRQSKTGAGVELPIGMVDHLVRRLEDEQRRQAERDHTATTLLIREDTGRPWNEHSFRHAFGEIRAELAKTHPGFETDFVVAGRSPDAPDAFRLRADELWFMHLRHTAVVRLAEAGCELPLIAAITGHTLESVKKILERYLVRTGEMARQAFAKRIAHERAL